ncbi:hypothetical protein ACFVS2_21475 [Brevibacillus sp. NPDC058079]|uniref:hypothetical protein n=1 Tax=Brevibacillus sp. NPDC058079 TaxID=3346330 RepID=UPI0036E5ACC7
MFNQNLNKSRYLRHPELNLLFRKEFIRFFVLVHIPFYIVLYFTREFPNFLASMDATMVLLAILYAVVVKPLIKNGTIRAYYRKHYRTKTTGSFLSIVYTALWFGAVLRSSLLVGNFLIQYFTFEERDLPGLVEGMKLNYLNGNGAIAGAIIFFLFIYVLYYKNRYISIQDFSIRVMQYVRERGFSLQVAMEKVLYEHKEGLATWKQTNDIDNKMKYPINIEEEVPVDYQKEEIAVEVYPIASVQDVPMEESEPTKSTTPDTLVPMRRQARR